jgi:ParB family chromosome partitioning protein
MAEKESVPAFVRSANDQELLEIALIENIQREDLNAIEIAVNYQRLIDECDITQSELAERVGQSRSTIANYLRLLKLPPDIQAAIQEKKLSMGHARAIINVKDADQQLYIFKQIMNKNLSVRQVEELVREVQQGKSKKSKSKKKKQLPREYQQLQDKLSSLLSTKVRLKTKKKGQGEIKIPFYSEEDLNRILSLLEK